MTLPRLTYFNLRGRAESIRLLLRAKDIEFDDHRVDSSEEWVNIKPTLPFTGLPAYEHSGFRVHESHAILRHLHRTQSIALPSEAQAVEFDTTEEVFAEAREDYWRFAWVKNYYDHLEKYADETLRPRLENLNRWLVRNEAEPKWWVGDELSYVDCIAYGYLDEVDAFFPSVFAEFKQLFEFHLRFGSQPRISDYLQSETRPIVFGMGCMGPKIDPRAEVNPGQNFASPWMKPLELEAFLPNQRRL